MHKSPLILCLIAMPFVLASGENAEEDAVNDAKETVVKFFEAFNAADNDALQDYMNYPHIFLTRNGQARIIEERWDMNFEGLREREGWRRSTIDSLEVSMVFEDKVHLNLVFSRVGQDGEIYRTVPGQWIVTKQDGRWGVQLRSY